MALLDSNWYDIRLEEDAVPPSRRAMARASTHVELMLLQIVGVATYGSVKLLLLQVIGL